MEPGANQWRKDAEVDRANCSVAGTVSADSFALYPADNI